jgi:hypothetical protein
MALEDIDIFDRFLQTKQLQQDQRQQVADTIAPTPAQATYIASFLAPGSSIPDVSGIYPSFPSSQVDLIDAFSGDPMPSLSTNLREGNYFDASMQGLGMAGDALYATPMIGPVLGPTVGTGLKAVSGVGRGISSLNKVQRAQDLIKQGKASAGTQQATQKMVAPTNIEQGKIIDVRKNLNSSFDDPELEKFKAQTIHDVKTLKSGKISDSESNIGTGTALSYDPAVTVKSNGVPIELKVNQKARDSIASKTKPKFPMASVRGIYDELDIFDPDITLGFNPMKQNVFVDSQGYGVKAIKNGKASIVDNDVLVKLDNPDSFRIIKDADGNEVKLFDDIEYYDSNNLPKTKNPSEVKVLDAEPKDMMFLHNTSEEAIKRFDALGGIPSPSLGVTKANQPLQGFGDIQLIGKPEKFDPAIDPSNKVYSADAYTPRAPQMLRFARQDADKTFEKDYKNFTEKISSKYGKSETDQTALGRDVINPYNTTLENLKNSVALQKKGSNFNIANRNDKFDRFFNTDLAKTKFFDDIGRNLDDATDRTKPFPQTKYNKWVTEQKNKYLDQEGVFEYFDDFEETFVTKPYTLDNVVSHMVSDTQRGGEAGLGSIGPNRLRAFMSKSFSDLPDIKSSKGSIGKSPPTSDVESDIVELLRKQAIDDKVKGQPEFTSIEDVSDMGFEGELLFEKVGENLQAGDNIEDAVALAYQDVYKVTRNDAFGGLIPSNNKNLKEIVEIFKKNAERPVEYFEAKPTRAVAFDEFAGAIVPPNTSKEVIDILKNRGLKVVKQTKKDYEKFDGKVNARKNFPKEMFALAPVGVASLMQEDMNGR